MSRGKGSFWKLGLSLLLNVSWKMLVLEASFVVSTKSVQQECPDKSVKQECPARVSRKSVKLECPARVSSRSVLSSMSGVSSSVKQECQERVSSRSVLARVSKKSV